jgi:L-lactate dehydrogenase
MDRSHVGIVGTGHVGMAAASALFHAQAVSRLTLVDLDRRRAEGEAMDLMHGQALVGPCTVRAGEPEALAGASVVVVSAGVSQQPGETRLDLLGRNAEVFRSVVADLDAHCPDAVVIVATNPVDVMTVVTRRLSCRPPGRVIGTGTLLDSARLRALLGQHYGVDPQSVHGYVLGEHGDSEFVPWSLVTIGGAHILGQAVLGTPWDEQAMRAIENDVRVAAYEIVSRKGWTNWAIGSVILELVAMVHRDEQTIAPVSVALDGEYGLRGSCLSLPARIGAAGIDGIVAPPLLDDELASLQASAAVLDDVVAALDLPAQ